MKKILAFILILAVMSQLLNKLLTYAAFKLQEDYIASVLCENKDKPEMHCNGHCQLTKKLQEDEKEDGRSAIPRFSEDQNINIFFSATVIWPMAPLTRFLSLRNRDEFLPEDPGFPDVFHPPC